MSRPNTSTAGAALIAMCMVEHKTQEMDVKNPVHGSASLKDYLSNLCVQSILPKVQCILSMMMLAYGFFIVMDWGWIPHDSKISWNSFPANSESLSKMQSLSLG